MSIKLRGGTYQIDYKIKGVPRVRFQTETADKELANQIEAADKAKRIKIRDGILDPNEIKTDFTVSQALGKYQVDHAEQPDARNVANYGTTLKAHFKGGTLISTLTTGKLLDFRRIMRGKTTTLHGKVKPLAASYINHHFRFLRRVFAHVEVFDAKLPKIDWRALMLPEDDSPTAIIASKVQQKEYRLALAEDARDVMDFFLLSGVRATDALHLTWKQVERDGLGGKIIMHGKSRQDGGKTHIVNITPTIAAILDRAKGHHPEYVFTFVARIGGTWRNKKTGKVTIHRAGQRYPYDIAAWRRRWNDMRRRVGRMDLNTHRLRATAITRAYQLYGLAEAQAFAGHSDMATTRRYVSVTADDVKRVQNGLDAEYFESPLSHEDVSKKEGKA